MAKAKRKKLETAPAPVDPLRDKRRAMRDGLKKRWQALHDGLSPATEPPDPVIEAVAEVDTDDILPLPGVHFERP